MFAIRSRSTGLFWTDKAKWWHQDQTKNWSSDINEARLYKKKGAMKHGRCRVTAEQMGFEQKDLYTIPWRDLLAAWPLHYEIVSVNVRMEVGDGKD